jgi:hypothetical protein
MASENLQPPKGFFKRGNIWWYGKSFAGKPHRISTGQRELGDAIAWVEQRPELTVSLKHRPPAPINPYHHRPFVFDSDWAKNALGRCRSSRGATNLTVEQVQRIVERAAGRCEVTGLPFTDAAMPGMVRKPFIPSLDRVNSHAPYSFDNCRLVCLSVNFALNQWGDSVFDLICLARCTTRLASIGAVNSSHQQERTVQGIEVQ